MALITTINSAIELKELFVKAERDYFSLYGCEEILRQFDDFDCELDIIALCCDYDEETPEEIKEKYSNIDEIAESETTADLIQNMSYYTYAVELTNGYILYLSF